MKENAHIEWRCGAFLHNYTRDKDNQIIQMINTEQIPQCAFGKDVLALHQYGSRATPLMTAIRDPEHLGLMDVTHRQRKRQTNLKRCYAVRFGCREEFRSKPASAKVLK